MNKKSLVTSALAGVLAAGLVAASGIGDGQQEIRKMLRIRKNG